LLTSVIGVLSFVSRFYRLNARSGQTSLTFLAKGLAGQNQNLKSLLIHMYLGAEA
jgi:hypothetical protein